MERLIFYNKLQIRDCIRDDVKKQRSALAWLNSRYFYGGVLLVFFISYALELSVQFILALFSDAILTVPADTGPACGNFTIEASVFDNYHQFGEQMHTFSGDLYSINTGDECSQVILIVRWLVSFLSLMAVDWLDDRRVESEIDKQLKALGMREAAIYNDCGETAVNIESDIDHEEERDEEGSGEESTNDGVDAI